MATFTNRYKGICQTCKCKVAPEAGFVIGEKGNWTCYCSNCVPERKGVATGTGRRELTADGRVVTPFERANLDLYRAMPGAWWDGDGDKCWKVSLELGDRARLLELADRLKLDVAPELRNYERSRRAKAASHAGLYPFQVDGVDWLARGTHRLLADEMGLGKTVETLCALPEQAACLCVVPASLKYNWENECKKWRPNLKPVVLSGRNSFRFPAPGEVVIINYDILPDWLKPQLDHPEAKFWEVNMDHIPAETKDACRNIVLVVDEAHQVKNYKTARSRKINGLARLCGRVWALTGTPLENRPLDLWGILSALQMAEPVFGTFLKFIEKMNGKKKFIGYHRPKFIGYEFGRPQPIVPELMRRVMLQRKRQEVLPDLPDKVYTTIVCPLPTELQTRMDDLWNEWGELIDEQKELPPFEEFSTIRAQLAASRIPILEELVEDHEEQEVPLVIFSAHVEPVRYIGSRDGWAFIDGSVSARRRQQIVEDFQAGRLKGVALTMRAGGVGLTLTHAWKVIEDDLDWVPSVNQQSEDRVCRIGQVAPHCEIVRLVSDHVLDQHVMELIDWKMGIIRAALEDQIEADADRVEEETETEAEFDERMRRAVALVEGYEDPDADENGWPPIMADDAIPF